MANRDPEYEVNGNGNGNGTWRWIVSGLAAALMAFALYVLNINWNIASQFASKQDTATHALDDDKRFNLLQQGWERQMNEVLNKLRAQDQDMRTVLENFSQMQARLTLVEGRQSDVRASLSELRAGQVGITQSLVELKQLMNNHMIEERRQKTMLYLHTDVERLLLEQNYQSPCSPLYRSPPTPPPSSVPVAENFSTR